MARVCFVFGLLLCGLTIAVLVMAQLKHPLHFIPMMLGIPILFCGVVGLNPHRLSTSLRFAFVIAVAGGLVGASRVGVCWVRLGGDHHVNIFALKVVGAMTVLCSVFAVLCLISLVRTQRRRLAAGELIAAEADGEAS